MPRAKLGPSLGSEVRRFACTSCGKCCDRGPEIELSEATALAGSFVTSVIFKVHSIPLNERTDRAAHWWDKQGSRIPLRAGFEEKRRHLTMFASRHRTEKRNDRDIYLEISSIVDDYASGRCPALVGNLCSIYDHRPLTCRTVPLHYSRQPSILQSYIDQFTATKGYECNTTSSPVVLDGSNIVSPNLRSYRERAIQMAKGDRKWKAHLLSFMDDPEAADRANLPTYETVLNNSENGCATLLPMIVAWRVAEHRGLISPDEFRSICEKQIVIIKAETARSPAAHDLYELLPLYEAGAAGRGSLSHAERRAGSF